MLNGINNFLSNQISQNEEVNKVMTNPFTNSYDKSDKSILVDESAISNEAVKLYQRDLDIRNFTQLSMSNPQDDSHMAMVENLFSNGVVDPYSDDAISDLVENDRFLEDLGL